MMGSSEDERGDKQTITSRKNFWMTTHFYKFKHFLDFLNFDKVSSKSNQFMQRFYGVRYDTLISKLN